jgi:DegV family protein with EDD domain
VTVAVVTDSAASLPAGLATDHGVTVVPLVLTVDGTAYDDGDLPLADVLSHPAGGVTTSGPSPGRVAATLEQVLERHDEALVLTISRAMSSTFDAARLGAQGFGQRARVLDTATAAGAQGLVALHAARCAATGAALADVEERARQAIERVQLVATVASLDRLVHSGRVPGIAGWAGGKLGVNPLFQFSAGRVKPLRPAFSRAAALERILVAWRRSRPPRDGASATLHAAALHAGAAAEADGLLAAVRAEVEPATAFIGEFSPVMVTHTGAGLVGLAWWWEPCA